MPEKKRSRTQHTRNSQCDMVVLDVKGNASNTFYFSAIKDWSSLPNDLKTCENIYFLKKVSKKVSVADGNR